MLFNPLVNSFLVTTFVLNYSITNKKICRKFKLYFFYMDTQKLGAETKTKYDSY